MIVYPINITYKCSFVFEMKNYMAGVETIMSKAIALGLGNNIDYEITWDSKVIEDLIVQYEIKADEIDSINRIKCIRDLILSILFFLKTETGEERFVEDLVVIEEFSSLFHNAVTVGGTSPRAAIAMARLGFDSYIHLVTGNEHIRRLLPPTSTWICSNTEDSFYPHLIVQYMKDTVVCANDINIRTGRANRIIYINDYDNMMMKLEPEFLENLGEAKVLLISGFNAMQEKALLQDRLHILKESLDKVSKKTKIYYEDACFYDPSMSTMVFDTIGECIDVYSMNEDELQNYVGREIDLLDTGSVLSALREVRSLKPGPVLIVHSKYWALGYGNSANDYAAALKGGITMATTRFRFGDDFTSEQYNKTYHLPDEAEGRLFCEQIKVLDDGMVCCLSSVEVEETKVTTVGLGDAFVGGFLPALI